LFYGREKNGARLRRRKQC